MLVSAILTQQSILLLKPAERLSPDFFYFTSNSLLYRAALESINQIEQINLRIFFVNLKTATLIDPLGGLDEVISLVEEAPLSNIIEEYSLVIVDSYIKRLLLISGDSLCLISCSKQPITQEQISSTVNQLTTAFEILEDAETQTLAKILANLLVHLDTTKKISISSSVMSGFSELDSITQGFQKSDLVIIAGRPSMGKTALAINIIRNVISKGDSHVILFSLEMSTEQLLRRILAQECDLNGQRIQSGQLNNDEWQNVVRKSKALANLNLFIDDSAEISTDTIKTKVKFFKLQGKKIELIIIDYLQLLQDNRQSDNRSQELSLITRSLKILAKDLNLPILVLSQLNRNLETRSNKRPLLSDLRESGCISKFSHVHIPSNGVTKILFNLYYKTICLSNFTEQIDNLFGAGKAYISRMGKKPIYKIITESNKYLELTSNHKICTSNGWKRCDEIEQNDMLAVQIKVMKINKPVFNYFSTLSLTFESVTRVKIISLQTVFDFNCQPLHNFIANSFIVHNSIEQDADLVIMLYRESYYNKEAAEADMTELIIAKHRNGPTGTFRLKFNANLATFSNI